MARLQIGISYARELSSGYGHVACTVVDGKGSTNYESRSSRGCVKGSGARGARNALFRHHFHLDISSDAAEAARRYADANVGERYQLGGVPSASRRGDGGDCSGFVSGIICAAKGRSPTRLFATATWPNVYERLGFDKGLGGGDKGPEPRKVNADRRYPGALRRGMKGDNVRWVQDRLNVAGKNKHGVLDGHPLVEDGDFGPKTEKVVDVFKRHRGLKPDGIVGVKAWIKLNAVK